MILVVALVISFKVSNKIFKPLSLLNMSMRDIINDGMKRDLDNEEIATQSCKEISDLYNVFQTLIKTKKFENNDFKQKEDALAVIDLAEACNMFIQRKEGKHGEKAEDPNWKAAGICYNNIANIQYKNGRYK